MARHPANQTEPSIQPAFQVNQPIEMYGGSPKVCVNEQSISEDSLYLTGDEVGRVFFSFNVLAATANENIKCDTHRRYISNDLFLLELLIVEYHRNKYANVDYLKNYWK